ncbi:MAG: transposase [Hyphomicrobium sp.]
MDFEGAWHNIVNRAAGRAAILSNPDKCELFLECVALAANRYGIEIHAYCLMTNHYHLLVRSLTGRLPDAMRFASGRFTRLKNMRDERDGPLFRGRYASREVGNDGYFAQVSRYIHLNPVEAALVQSAEDWPWSSGRYYLGASPKPDRLQTSEILELFGPPHASTRYADFLREGVEEITRRRNAEMKD